ncbi:PIN domain protein [Acidisarcina polymorpha]|uniref:PIN domain protein n=1 Tax=Acidisarcina polymorpha TaxID=2211140 RepID=A0A2Z5G1I7_9BACT|nr:PIN domain-containing protein [Acidisarcina polymorpha]AXC12961.1 PIN domain protein [Acidisarcina polymorpha]
MSAKTFVDTNLLVYAYDVDAGSKQERAIDVLTELWRSREGRLSTQVLQEFYVSVTRKLTSRLSRTAARRAVELYSSWSVDITPTDIVAAFRIEDEAKISFWDALILSSAQKIGASRILSEDLNTGQKVAGIVIENPFSQMG